MSWLTTAQQAGGDVGTKAFVKALLTADDNSVFRLDEVSCSVDAQAINPWGPTMWVGVYRVMDRRIQSRPTGDKIPAIEWASQAAAEYAVTAGYERPENRTMGDIAIAEEVERQGFLTSGGYDYIIRRVVPDRGSAVWHVIERVPAPNDRARRDTRPTLSITDADIFPNVAFTRLKDAQTYLIFGEYERLWAIEAPPRAGTGLSSALVNAIREMPLPRDSKIVSGFGWREMDMSERVAFVRNEYNRTVLDGMRRDDAAVILDGIMSGDLNALVDTMRRMTGMTVTAPSPTLILVVSDNRATRQMSPATPATPGTTPATEPAKDFFEGIEPPDETDDSDFGIILSSTGYRHAGNRKGTVVSFDYDSTTVIPNYDPATGECETDEDGELVSTLNPVAAALMRRHHARGDKVVIVTARPPDSIGSIWQMIRDNSLPVSEVYATNHHSKAPTLRSIGATIHYDDSPFHVDDVNRMLGPRTKAYYDSDMERHLEEGRQPKPGVPSNGGDEP